MQKALQATFKVTSMLLFCFSFSPLNTFCSQKGILHKRPIFLNLPNYSATPSTSWVLVLSPPAAPQLQFHLFEGIPSASVALKKKLNEHWSCYRAIILQKLHISAKKKSNEMTRHRRWKNSNICWKCHKQQRSEQQKPPERGKKSPKTAKYN